MLKYFIFLWANVAEEICIRCPPGEGPCKKIPCPVTAEGATTDESTTTANTHTLTVSNGKLMFDNRRVISGEDEGGMLNSDGDTCYKCTLVGGTGGCKPIPCPVTAEGATTT